MPAKPLLFMFEVIELLISQAKGSADRLGRRSALAIIYNTHHPDCHRPVTQHLSVKER